MNTNLYSEGKVDFLNEPMFLGNARNTQKFEQLKYKFFDERNDAMLARYWRPQEINMTKDKADFEKNMTDAEKRVMTKVLQKLIFLDSLQGRAPIFTFGQITTLPEIENVILTWSFFEGAIHSRTYSYNLQNVYPNPTEVFDGIFDDAMIMKQARTQSREYNVLYEAVIDYLYKSQNDIDTDDTLRTLVQKIILAMVSVNILEGTRFYAGFASIWALTEAQGKVTGTSKQLKLIARDENIHLSMTQKWCNGFRKGEFGQMFKEEYAKLEPKIIEMYMEAIAEEHEWAEYLFSEGSVIGLNDVLLKSFVSWIANQRTKAIGLGSLFDAPTKNPLPWTEHWMKEGGAEATPQEEEITDYVQGQIQMDDFDIDDIMKGI